MHLSGSLACITAIGMATLFVANIQGRQTSDPEKPGRILKGTDPVVIVATVVAVSTDTIIEGEATSADIMLLKVGNTLSGTSPGDYVRADFNHRSSIRIDAEKARRQRQLLVPLREGKVMKIHLRPPVEGVECRWPIPPPAKPGEVVGIVTPTVIPVGGAKGYPDINRLPCYAFELQDFEDVATPSQNR
jgi:hypothetical protein